jgi:hypothetical protein
LLKYIPLIKSAKEKIMLARPLSRFEFELKCVDIQRPPTLRDDHKLPKAVLSEVEKKGHGLISKF